MHQQLATLVHADPQTMSVITELQAARKRSTSALSVRLSALLAQIAESIDLRRSARTGLPLWMARATGRVASGSRNAGRPATSPSAAPAEGSSSWQPQI